METYDELMQQANALYIHICRIMGRYELNESTQTQIKSLIKERDKLRAKAKRLRKNTPPTTP